MKKSKIVDLYDYMIISDYAKLKNITGNWVHRMIKDGKLQTINHYGRTLIYVGDDDNRFEFNGKLDLK